MDRQIVYAGELLRSVDFAQMQQSIMVAHGWLGQLMVGTTPVAAGLAIAPVSPADLAVTIGPGILSALSVIEATPFGIALPADAADPLLKFGVNPTSTPIAFTPPLGTGGSVTWQTFTVYAAFEEYDTSTLSLPFYNAANPTQQLNGQGGSAALLPTQRLQRLVINATSGGVQATQAGALASQTPVPQGAVALYAVTLASTATVVSTANITPVAASPFDGSMPLGMGLRPGRLIGVQRFQGAGTYTYTPTTGARIGVVRVQGAGGGGGAANATGGSTVSAGQGGGAGGYGEVRLTTLTGLSVQTVTVGRGGTTAPSAAGGNGGASSFGSVLSATGGGGGANGGAASVTTTVAQSFGVGGTATGGDLMGRGGDGGFAIYNPTQATSGGGGRSRYGHGGSPVTGVGVAQIPGQYGYSAGAGGGGASAPVSSGSYSGGIGADGIVEIEEYS